MDDIEFIKIRIMHQHEELHSLLCRLEKGLLSKDRYELLRDSALGQLQYLVEKHLRLRPLLETI